MERRQASISRRLSCKLIVRNPWREADPNKRSSSSNNRHDNELRTFETLWEADARSIGKRQFGQGSWSIVAPRRNASKMVIFHPIKFKSFPTPIAVSSSWTMDCRREPTFPRTPVKMNALRNVLSTTETEVVGIGM